MTVGTVITDDDIAVGDAVSAQLEKMWGWYLVGGIFSMIFGFFVISYRHASVYAIIYLASGFFIAVGVFEIVGAIRMARQRWLHLVFGLIWIGAGIVGFVWPHITIFIVAVLIGWAFLVLGIFDIIDSIRNHYLPYWWAYLIRGIIAVAIGFLCIRHPGAPLTALVVLIGIVAILFGAVEVIGAFSARHATKTLGDVQGAARAEASGEQPCAWRQLLAPGRDPATRPDRRRRDRRPERPRHRAPGDHARTAGARSRRVRGGPRRTGTGGRPAIRCRRCGVTRPCPIRPPSSPSA